MKILLSLSCLRSALRVQGEALSTRQMVNLYE
jgi:hypothetical protein